MFDASVSTCSRRTIALQSLAVQSLTVCCDRSGSMLASLPELHGSAPLGSDAPHTHAPGVQKVDVSGQVRMETARTRDCCLSWVI